MRWSDYGFSPSIPDVHVYTFASIHIHSFIANNTHACIGLKYRSLKSLQHPTLTKKYERWKACSPWCSFPRRIGVSKSVAHLTSLLEQAFRNASNEGPSNWPVTFVQTPTTAQKKNGWTCSRAPIQSNIYAVNSTNATPCNCRCIC